MSHTESTSHTPCFLSDNAAGAHPEVIAALTRVNSGATHSYGDDPVTAELAQVIQQHFGAAAQTYPVFNGTGANILALTAACPRWGAVLCADSAHINADEGGAPEKISGLKLLTVRSENGKVTVAALAEHLDGVGFKHAAQPAAVSISQTTEFGTCYTPSEIAAIAEFAHANSMLLHLDGARIGNAAAHLGVPLRDFTTDAGVDILSLGGTKNGALAAEAVVVLAPEKVSGMEYIRKHQMQLASKMRFISAQLLELYGTELWRTSAGQANNCAQILAHGITTAGYRVTRPVEGNAVFAQLPPEVRERAHRAAEFYDWPGLPGEVRLMCSWNTSESDVAALLCALSDD